MRWNKSIIKEPQVVNQNGTHFTFFCIIAVIHSLVVHDILFTLWLFFYLLCLFWFYIKNNALKLKYFKIVYMCNFNCWHGTSRFICSLASLWMLHLKLQRMVGREISLLSCFLSTLIDCESCMNYVAVYLALQKNGSGQSVMSNAGGASLRAEYATPLRM